MLNGRTLWFPGNTKKAVTLSYDDGVIFDEKLCEILAPAGVKCTFNIGSERGDCPRHMSIPECISLHRKYGHETAFHGANHMFYGATNEAQMVMDVVNDRVALEQATGDFIIGGAYPYGAYNEDVKTLLRLSGIRYCRTANSTNCFNIPTDWLEWNPTCHHASKDMMPLLEKFLAGNPWLAQVFYLWGHSYEFHDDNNWEIMEAFCNRIAGEPVWFATNGEIYEYVNAYNQLRFFADDSIVYNPTQMDVWFAELRDETPICVPAGKRVRVATGEVL